MSSPSFVSIAFLALVPALLVAGARVLAAAGVDLPAVAGGLLSPDAAVASALIALAVPGAFAVLTLRTIARDTHEILLRARIRDQADGLVTGASVVDFAIHLDRRREVALGRGRRDADGDQRDAGDDAAVAPPPARGFPASEALRDVKSRLADIPSVRRDSRA